MNTDRLKPFNLSLQTNKSIIKVALNFLVRLFIFQVVQSRIEEEKMMGSQPLNRKASASKSKLGTVSQLLFVINASDK